MGFNSAFKGLNKI